MSPERLDELGQHQLTLAFHVHDTGIGIPEDKQKLVFEAFSQADYSSTRNYGGTGLGLSISSQLVSMMGGRICVESQPGQGSTFSFTAIFGARDSAARYAGAIDLKGLPVLIVDDNATSLHMLDDMLRMWGAHPTSARNAEAAFAEFQRAQAANSPFPLVLLDSEMPGTNGFELAGKMGHNAGLAATPNIIMMISSAADRIDAGRCRAAGIQTSVVKPIFPADMRTAVLNSLHSFTAAPLPPASSTGSSQPLAAVPLRILLVEDNPVNRKVAVGQLQKQGHTVITANNGLEALAIIDKIDWQVDLVLMDVQMPEMDGYQATAAIRTLEEKRSQRLPIVAMTAHALDRDRERCLAAGMDAYLSKPIRLDLLIAILHRVGNSKLN